MAERYDIATWKDGKILYFDKPLGWTSFKVVGRVRYAICHSKEWVEEDKDDVGSSRKMYQKIKVGHAGTLDPMATGVLIIATGKATKKIDELQGQTKEYVAEMKLGATTASYDRETAENAAYPIEHITEEMIKTTLERFQGEIEQVPPEYSACKVDGKRAYELARKGQEVNLKKKILRIDEIEMLDYTKPVLKIRVVCSKGTYIRALARDIGEALGSGAYLTSLRRTRVGNVKVEECHDVEDFITQLRFRESHNNK